tara:strand:+ start:519 stop:806 length:288 start_codon:yes stop_codon:yes gene_type:complete
MNLEKDISEQLTTLNNTVDNDNELKEYIINYVGNKLDPKDEQVTIGMIIDVLADDFPQLVLCLSEENWVRGYQQALSDVEEGEKLYNEEISKVQE